MVEDLAATTEFFAELGLELQGEWQVAFAVEDIDACDCPGAG